MGQKVNPTSLRLHPRNKHFDSCWFSEKGYAHSLHKDLNIGTYYNAILKQIQYPSAYSFLEASPRKLQISFLFLNPKQLREQSFRQLGHINSRNRRRKQNTLFSTKKETTSLYGLLERRKRFLRLLPPYFFTPLFLQGFRKGGSAFSLENTKRGGEERRENRAFTKLEDLIVSSFSHVRKMDLLDKGIKPSSTLLGNYNQITQLSTQFTSFSEKKGRMPLLLSKTGRRFAPFLPRNLREKQVEGANRQNCSRLKRSLCSSVLGLAISHYFVQKNLSGNFLSVTSRFLLLEALFPFLKKGEDWSGAFDGFCPQDGKSHFHVPEQVWTCDKIKHKDFSFSLKEKENKNHSLLEEISSLQRSLSLSAKKNQNRSPQENPNHNASLYAEHRGLQRDTPLLSGRMQSPYESKQGNYLLSHLQKSSIYTYNMESIISNRLKSSCKILLFRAQNVAQSALFIAEEIAYQLERRNGFRQIKTKFLQELASKTSIKGVRVTCVGRMGGRAKKAQRARGESFKMGQTSLHLFDSRVSFASKTAFTPYGAVGVKVWVCWK